jgi:hypothetical protein
MSGATISGVWPSDLVRRREADTVEMLIEMAETKMDV